MCQIYQFSHYLNFHLKQPRGMLVNLTSILYIFSAQLSYQLYYSCSSPAFSHSFFCLIPLHLPTIHFCHFLFDHNPILLALKTNISHFSFSHCLSRFQLLPTIFPFQLFPTVYAHFSISCCLFPYQFLSTVYSHFNLYLYHCMFSFSQQYILKHFSFLCILAFLSSLLIYQD